jgi:FkbM family methyltransferase
MSYPRLPFLFRSYFVYELPAWDKLYHALGLGGIDNQNPRWRQGPTFQTRGKRHGYLMELDLSDDIERSVYFLKRYYDLDIQLVLDVLLRPGDTFLDIGANVGMTTLYAASRVGPLGRVVSVEPQPACCAKLRRALELNGISHVDLHNVGLSDRPGVLTLHVLGGGTIGSTFAVRPGDEKDVSKEISVQVLRGDDMFQGPITGRLIMKIDVEGFELFVLQGFSKTIEDHAPPIVAEVKPDLLRRAGVEADHLFDFFHERGYHGYMISLVRRRLRWSLGLQPIERPTELVRSNDVLWISGREGGVDLSPYLVSHR